MAEWLLHKCDLYQPHCQLFSTPQGFSDFQVFLLEYSTYIWRSI